MIRTKEEKAKYQRAWRLCNMDRVRAYERSYKTRHLEKKRLAGRDNYGRLRQEMLIAYGTRCACCGETEPMFLTLDHIFNDGAEERGRLGNRRSVSTKFYRMIRDSGWPKDRYQLLCYNCNCAKAHGGCPHKSEANVTGI